MSSPSRVEGIFFNAVEKASAEERSAYLGQACGDDAELRRRVERLLEAHPRAEGFLSHPAVDRPGLDPRPGSVPSHRREEAGPDRSPADGRDDEHGALSFLEPSGRPGSLGRLAHYEFLEVLGRGAFGTVVKAFDEKLQRLVAIKLLAPNLATTPTQCEQFVREACSAAAVRHENVIAIHAVEDHPTPYLVMEYVAGSNLQQTLDASGPLKLRDVLRIGSRAAAGLAAAHAIGLIHRDIKPGNILLDDAAGQVKLTDFGLAHAADDARNTRSGYIAGTPMYMAPEQALGETVDQRADLFSLGSVLYVMCCGKPPFRATNSIATLKRVAEDTPRPIREINPEVPEWLCGLVSRLHAKNRADRVGSAQEVADLLARRLTELQRGDPPEAAEPTSSAELSEGKPAPPPPRRTGRLWATMAAIPTLLLGMGLSEAAGITDVGGTVVRLFSPDGTLVVEVDDPGVSVQIDGADVVIQGAGAHEIRVKPGRYSVEASKGGKVVRRELVDVTRNGRRVVRVSQEPRPVDTRSVATAPGVASNAAGAAAWELSVADLPAVELVKAVARRMQELNPGFDGSLSTRIEGGVVRELTFVADHVSDLSPVRVLTSLTSLDCSGSDAFKGQLINGSPSRGHEEGQVQIRSVDRSRMVDLSPLRGLPLRSLSCVNTHVHDLTPLAGMKLTSLSVASTQVFDLSPLKGMPLESLDCGFTRVADLAPLNGMRLTRAQFEDSEVSDLSPLKGMPLTHLSIGRNVSDLAPLRGMSLHELGCRGSRVSDLSPLRGMPLSLLSLCDTRVVDLAPLEGVSTLKRLYGSDETSDLSPIRGLPLEYLHAGPLVKDLSPLEAMPLKKLEFLAFKAERDAEILRGLPTLEIINDRPAAQFWSAVEQQGKRTGPTRRKEPGH